MRFADKLFFAVTAVLTVIFAVFGIGILSVYFQKNLNRELEQANTESQMFQYLFEMAYQSASEYGDEIAVQMTLEGIMPNIEKENNRYFVLNQNGEFLYGEEPGDTEAFRQVILEIKDEIQTEDTYAYRLHKEGDGHYLLNICKGKTGGDGLYLGMCKDLTQIYEDRQSLLNQYRLALFLLVFIGGLCIYVLSRYLTRPIRRLDKVVGQIAAGNYALRSGNTSPDEIGELSRNFNRMTDRLVAQMEEKKLEAKQKEDFMAAFAHELKTPLTSIIGYADMLNSMKLTEEESSEAYYYIYSQGKRLESLSHKLLELVSTQKQPVPQLPIPTQELEQNLRITMRPIFKQKKITGKIVFEKGVLYGDFELLLSLFYNLCDNAVKAVSENGFIMVRGTLLEEGYEVKVVDNGRGIPEQEISRVTEAFYMVDKSRSRKEGGAGIGMTLCMEIIRKHGGSLEISSKPEEGTVIRLLFPKNPGRAIKEEPQGFLERGRSDEAQ